MDICDVSGVLSKKCRACLSENQDSFSLFDIYENDITLADILQNCLSTKVIFIHIYSTTTHLNSLSLQHCRYFLMIFTHQISAHLVPQP